MACLLAACSSGLDLDETANFVSMDPAEGATEVSRRPTIIVRFDRPLLPESVHRGTISLWSGSTRFPLSIEADPTVPGFVARRLGGAALVGDIIYDLRIDGVRSLDGALSEPLELSFRTGEATDAETPREVGWAEAQAVLDTYCVDCHAEGDFPDFSSPEGIARTAIGVSAGQRAFRSPERGLAGLEIISVLGGSGRPGFSYLLYALVRDPHLLGGPMPPDETLPAAEITLLRDWIRSGAPLE